MHFLALGETELELGAPARVEIDLERNERHTLALHGLRKLVDLASMQEEAVTQSMVFASQDYREGKAARAEKREPKYRGR